MEGKPLGTDSVTRRRILGLAGSATAALTGGIYLLSSNPKADPDDATAVEGSPVATTVDRVETESLLDYGGEPNPEDPGLAAARANLDALHAAADAAGENGAIHVPAGTYYFGHDGTGVDNLLLFTRKESREPAGVSIYGDGPEETRLAITEHMPDDQNHNALIYDGNAGHGRVEIRNLTLDGNYENLGALRDVNRSSRGIVVKENNAESTFDLYNVRFRGWYTNGVRLKDAAGSARRCTWEENGIGQFNDGGVSHHVACSPVAGNEFRFERCHFRNCSGKAVNIRHNRGRIVFRWCYGEGLGTGVHKISAGDVIRHEHCYWQPHNQWVDENLRRGENPEHIGWDMFHRFIARDGAEPTLGLYDVEIRNTNAETFYTRRTGPAIVGDRIAVHSGAFEPNRDGVFKEDSDGYMRFDVDRLSVHDSGEVFNLDRADGRIRRLHRGGNRAVGDYADLAVRVDDPNADPFEPDVPSRSEVGILRPSRRR